MILTPLRFGHLNNFILGAALKKDSGSSVFVHTPSPLFEMRERGRERGGGGGGEKEKGGVRNEGRGGRKERKGGKERKKENHTQKFHLSLVIFPRFFVEITQRSVVLAIKEKGEKQK